MTQKPAKRIERKHGNDQHRAGAVTVEFALVAPIIFSVFFGAIEISNLNFLRNMANDTAFQVARSAIVPGANISNIETDAKDFMAAIGINKPRIVTSEITGGLIEVVVTIPVDQNSWGLGRFALGNSIVEGCQLAKQVK